MQCEPTLRLPEDPAECFNVTIFLYFRYVVVTLVLSEEWNDLEITELPGSMTVI